MARRSRITWSIAALSDLDAVTEYLSQDSKGYAAAVVRRIRQASRSLRHFPEAGSPVTELDDESIREVYAYRYRVVYQVSSAREVVILRVIHSSRRFESAWNKDDPPEEN